MDTIKPRRMAGEAQERPPMPVMDLGLPGPTVLEPSITGMGRVRRPERAERVQATAQERVRARARGTLKRKAPEGAEEVPGRTRASVRRGPGWERGQVGLLLISGSRAGEPTACWEEHHTVRVDRSTILGMPTRLAHRRMAPARTARSRRPVVNRVMVRGLRATTRKAGAATRGNRERVRTRMVCMALVAPLEAAVRPARQREPRRPNRTRTPIPRATVRALEVESIQPGRRE
jgi:hypothetical protein